MSLVCGHIDQGRISLTSDTLIIPRNDSSLRKKIAPKIFFLGKDLAVGYAGETSLAHQIIHKIYRKNWCESAIEEALDVVSAAQKSALTDRHISKDSVPDFIFAQSAPQFRLIRVRAGHPRFDVETLTHIGNTVAASHFSETYKENSDSFAAMSGVIRSGCFKNVGGYVNLAQSSGNGFTFLTYLELNGPMDPEPPAKNWEKIDFGGAARGGYGYTSVVPVCAGSNGWGLYFFQANFGFFFHIDLESDIYEKLRAYASTAHEFADLVSADIGIELQVAGELG